MKRSSGGPAPIGQPLKEVSHTRQGFLEHAEIEDGFIMVREIDTL
jgi:hypothetical protein